MMDIDGFQCFPFPKSQGRNRKPYKTHQKKTGCLFGLFCFAVVSFQPKRYQMMPNVCFLPASVRWNNHKLKELRDEEDCAMFRQRASRLSKWKELVEEAAKAKSMTLSPPDAIESLIWRMNDFLIFLVFTNHFQCFFKYPYRINQIYTVSISIRNSSLQFHNASRCQYKISVNRSP